MLQRLLVILVLLAAPSTLAAADLSRLTIETASGERHFTVELAVTGAQHQRGLMFREQMATHAGMLFLFGDRAHRSFWMKNTLLSLDILFIDEGGRIMKVHHRAVPGSLDSITSDHPVVAVLEINGGLARRMGIKAGDIVRHPALGND